MKVNCVNPAHKDSTPSLHVYKDGCFCFVCGFTCKIEEILNGSEIEAFKKTKPEPVVISEAIRHIESLPKKEIRGLQLPYDDSGYYIVWPDRSFYKQRVLSGKTRYLGPKGHKPPLFKLRSDSNLHRTLIVVEGELNAMSLDAAISGYSWVSIVSPGSANSFEDFIDIYTQYKRVYLILDKDPSGMACGEPLRKQLTSKKIQCTLILVDPDFNETLVKHGAGAVVEQFKKELGL